VGPNCSADTIKVVVLARIYCWEATSSGVCMCMRMCVPAQAHGRLACLQSRRMFFDLCWTHTSSMAS